MTTNLMARNNDPIERPKDPVDLSREHIEREVHEEIERIRIQANKLDAKATGKCLDCGKKFKLDDRRRWCNDVCRDSWQEFQEHSKKNNPTSKRR